MHLIRLSLMLTGARQPPNQLLNGRLYQQIQVVKIFHLAGV
jgi:hypothetical protein